MVRVRYQQLTFSFGGGGLGLAAFLVLAGEGEREESDEESELDEPEDEQLSLKLWQALMERLVNAVGGPLCSTLLVADSLEIIAHACCALSKLSAANSTAQVQGPTGASPYPGTHTLVHVSPMGDIKIIICLLTKCISCEVDITGRLSATVVWSPFKNVSERIFLGSDCSYVLHDFVG